MTPEHRETLLKKNGNMPTTAELLGLDKKYGPSVVVIESRLPTVDNKGYERIIAKDSHKIGSDGVEALIDPLAAHVIVPVSVDPSFKEYAAWVSGRRKSIFHVDHTRLTGVEVRKFVDYFQGAMYYGMWPVPELEQQQQVVDPLFQERANAKGWLEAYIASQYIPPRLLVSADPSDQNARYIEDLTKADINAVRGNEDVFWAKAGNFGMSSYGVQRCESQKDVEKLLVTLRDLGVEDQIILERHMPGLGGSFTLAKDTEGAVTLLAVTDQLSNSQGKRIGNVIYDISRASGEVKTMIADVRDSIERHPEFQGKVGFYVYDVVRDRDGRPYINDPAQRKSGTTPTAMLRNYWIGQHHLNPADVFASQVSLYLKPKIDFEKVLSLLGEHADFRNGRQTIVRVHYDAHDQTSVKLALLSAKGPEVCEEMKSNIRETFARAGVLI